MEVVKDIKPLRTRITEWRNRGESIAFVPTMGNLHEGHLSLVEIAGNNADHVVVSIYVNPMQFSPDEDFATYPRTIDDDLDKLVASGTDMVFTPDSSSIYGSDEGVSLSTYCEVPALSDILEGEYRPGFFRGVATVVLKLFNIVQPDVAVFGEKDFQQLLVIKKMVDDLCLPINILSGETLREPDGLAMSSRNNYLSVSDRKNSRLLYENLNMFLREVEQRVGIQQAEKACTDRLNKAGFSVDYISLRDASGLQSLSDEELMSGREVIVLAAARLGKTRLIDNIRRII